jgi:starvation-inducible outer membrane lipoprotein
MNSEKRAKFMQGRMTEAGRVAKMSDSRKFIYPYTWLKYYDTKQFVEKVITNYGKNILTTKKINTYKYTIRFVRIKTYAKWIVIIINRCSS